MAELDPSNTNVGDICRNALAEANVIGVGQTPSNAQITAAWTRLQWMLQEWYNKRWLVYHNLDKSVVSTGAQTYTIGPGGQIDTGSQSQRPSKLESAFLRQITQSQPNQIDYPLELIFSFEDYSRIALKKLTSFAGWIFLDPAWPLGVLYPWPVPQASIYEVHVIIRDQLPTRFTSLTQVFNIPFEYYNCMVLNLAIRLRAHFGIPTFQGDMLPGLAKDSLNTLRNSNNAVSRLQMPRDLVRSGIYDIFGDRSY